jgi:hypothetical protein
MEIIITEKLQNSINILNSVLGVKSVTVSESTSIINSQINNVDSLVFNLTSEKGNTVKFIIPKSSVTGTMHSQPSPFMDVITERLQFLDDNINPNWIEPCYYINMETTRVEVVREDISPIAANTELQLLVDSLEALPEIINVTAKLITSGNGDNVLFTYSIAEHPWDGNINFVAPFIECTNIETHKHLINNAIELINQTKTGNITSNQP